MITYEGDVDADDEDEDLALVKVAVAAVELAALWYEALGPYARTGRPRLRLPREPQ